MGRSCPSCARAAGIRELCLGMDEELAESLWVMTSAQTNMVNVVLGICYGPHGEEKEVDGTFSRQLEEASRSQALVFVGDFNHPDVLLEEPRSRAQTVQEISGLSFHKW